LIQILFFLLTGLLELAHVQLLRRTNTGSMNWNANSVISWQADRNLFLTVWSQLRNYLGCQGKDIVYLSKPSTAINMDDRSLGLGTGDKFAGYEPTQSPRSSHPRTQQLSTPMV